MFHEILGNVQEYLPEPLADLVVQYVFFEKQSIFVSHWQRVMIHRVTLPSRMKSLMGSKNIVYIYSGYLDCSRDCIEMEEWENDSRLHGWGTDRVWEESKGLPWTFFKKFFT